MSRDAIEMIPKAEGSTSGVKTNKSLEDKRKWADIINEARESSKKIINSPEESVRNKLEELEAKVESHPEPPNQEGRLRKITLGRGSVSKVAQSYEATKRMVADIPSIHAMLTNPNHSVA